MGFIYLTIFIIPYEVSEKTDSFARRVTKMRAKNVVILVIVYMQVFAVKFLGKTVHNVQVKNNNKGMVIICKII